MDPGDHGLWDLVDPLHHAGADVEQLGVEAGVPVDHLAQVVTGGERRAIGGEYHDLAVGGKGPDGLVDLVHERQRQGVASLGPGQRESGDGGTMLDPDVLHTASMPPESSDCCHSVVEGLRSRSKAGQSMSRRHITRNNLPGTPPTI
jgi:hypothetical protein